MAKTTKEVTGIAFTTDAAKLTKMVESVLKSAKTLIGKMHQVAVNCAIHGAVHGDVSLLNRLCDALPGGFRKQALLAWFENEGPVTYVKGDKKAKDEAARKGKFEFAPTKAAALKAEFEKDKDACVKRLLSVNFGDYTKEAEYQGFDLSVLAHALVSRAEKVAKGDNATHDKTNLSGLEALRSAVSSIFKKQGTKEQQAA